MISIGNWLNDISVILKDVPLHIFYFPSGHTYILDDHAWRKGVSGKKHMVAYGDGGKHYGISDSILMRAYC